MIDQTHNRRRFLSNVFVRKNALGWFFVTSFVISWLAWFMEPALRSRDHLAAGMLIQIGTYGPALAAMAVRALTKSNHVKTNAYQYLLVGSAVLGLALWINRALFEQIIVLGSQPHHWLLSTLLTLLPAFVFSSAFASALGSQTMKRLLAWRTNLGWLVIALTIMLLLSISGVMLIALVSRQPALEWIGQIQSSEVMRNLGLAFFATLLYGGPLGEEPGWRTFALPRLQKRFDPLLASVILGALWGIWHFPLHLTGYYNHVFGDPFNGILMRMFSTIPLTLIFTWLYNRTKGSLFIMIILHTAVNVTSGMINPGTGMFITTTLAVVAMVVFGKMYTKAQDQQEGPQTSLEPESQSKSSQTDSEILSFRRGGK